MMRYLLRLILAGLTVGLVLVAQTVHADGWDRVSRQVRVTVLMYHYVDHPPANASRLLKDLVVTPENFTAQMQWLKDQGYQSITPTELMNALWHGDPLPNKPVMITFDDGYASMYYNAFPILRQFGFTGVFFVITDFIDAGKAGYLTWDAARAMVQGGMYIENHTRSHVNLKNRSAKYLEDQIVGAQNAIEQHTGYRPQLFAYPFGAYDHIVTEVLFSAGLEAAFTTQNGYYAYSSNRMHIPRVRIRGATTLDEFARLIRRGD